MAVKIQFGAPNEPAVISGSSHKQFYTQVAGIDGLRLERGSVVGATKALGVGIEFQAQLDQLDQKIALERERLDELYEFDSRTGQRDFKKSADGTTRRAEEAAADIQRRIDALEYTRAGQAEIARHRWAEAHAADVAAAAQPSDAELSIIARAEREATMKQNEARARHGLDPAPINHTGLKIG